MENSITNRNLLNRLKQLCEGTPYELHIWEREGFIMPGVSIRKDAPEFTPDFYLYDDLCFTGSIRVEVQTTSYGALAPESVLQVAQGLMAAAQLAKAMSVEIQLAGIRVVCG